jgi:hypothetical protein
MAAISLSNQDPCIDPSQLLGLLFVLGFIARLLVVPESPTSWDEVDFTCALQRFDIPNHSPHFPGYPGYVLITRIFACFLPAKYALALPGLLSSLVVSLGLVRLMGRRFGSQSALMLAFLLNFSPLMIMESARPMSDTLALSMVLGAWLLLPAEKKRDVYLGAILLGLLPAVKADHGLLWTLVILAPAGQRLRATGIMVLTFALWQIPFFAVTDWNSWLKEGRFFVSGHFSDWGGSVQSSSSSFTERFTKASKILSFKGFLVPPMLLIPFLLWLGSVFYAKRREWASNTLFPSILALSPMILWVFFAQNLDHPRHLLILVPFIALIIAAALAKSKIAGLWLLIMLISLGTQWPQALERRATHEGSLELNRFVATKRWTSICKKSIVTLYVGESARLLKLAHPHLDIRRARRWSSVEQDLAANPSPPERVYVSSEVIKDLDRPHRLVFCGPGENSYSIVLWGGELPSLELPLPEDH